MRSVVWILVICCAFIKLGSKADNNTRLHLIINNMVGECPGLRNLPIKIGNISIQNINGLFSVNYTEYVTRYIGNDLLLKVEVRRCQSKETLDTCVRYADLNTRQTCKLLNINSEFYSPFTQCLRPTVKCPIGKGIFYGKNCTYNMDSFTMFPIIGAYWRVKIELLHGSTKEHLFCGTGEGMVRRKV